MSQEQPPFGLPGPILAEIQRRPRSRIKFKVAPGPRRVAFVSLEFYRMRTTQR